MTNALIGGICIGSAAVLLMWSIGRVAGVTGIASNAMKGEAWAIVFIAGLGVGGWLGAALFDLNIGTASESIPAYLIAGGMLVGLGTRLGSGCTSGHGVCGTARFSLRSVVATVTFVGVGMITATWIRV